MEKQDITMNDLLKEFDFKKIYNGETIKGEVIKVTDKCVYVNINFSSDGLITKEEFCNEDENLLDIVKVGEEITTKVLSINNGDGYVLLSKKVIDDINSWNELSDLFKNNEKISFVIKEEVKGGLITFYNGIRVFMPASQASGMGKIDIKTLLGKEVEVEIIEFDKHKKRVVISRRVIDERIKEEKRIEAEKIREEKKIAKENKINSLWDSLKVGNKIIGKVANIVKFGAFIDIGGIQGLVHNNDISWGKTVNAEDVLNVGEEVEVFIQNVDKENRRLSLSLKDFNNNPWDNLNGKYKPNDILEGLVVKFMNFGAFVEVETGIEGLVHISEISEDHIAKASEVLKIGQKIKVKILDVDEKNHKMSLSIKEAIEKSKEYLHYVDNDEEDVTLGDIFAKELNKLNLK